MEWVDLLLRALVTALERGIGLVGSIFHVEIMFIRVCQRFQVVQLPG
jgi:hypothetical protein